MPYTTAEHLRLAMEDLGTTAIKLGQILSTRPDFVGPEYVAEFEKLRDRVPPVPTEAILGIIESELGATTDQLFAEFERNPLAAASIGQVHGAVLHDGMRVVVKVQKPGAAETVAQDLVFLADLARRASGGGDSPASTICRLLWMTSPGRSAPSSTTSVRAATPTGCGRFSRTSRPSLSPPSAGR